jgi:rSAM/selenodomain-associated transferase 1
MKGRSSAGRAENNWRLALFLRHPRPGHVKTRLAASVGAERAASSYRALVEDILEALSEVGDHTVPYFDSPQRPGEQLPAGLGRLLGPRVQEGADLGARMAGAIRECFCDGADRVLLSGSDIPGLDADLIRLFSRKLQSFPVVLGPAADGGYYLIGFQRAAFDSRVFSKVRWSSDDVADQTIERIRALDLEPYVGRPLQDVDTLEDLRGVLATATRIPRLRSLMGENADG